MIEGIKINTENFNSQKVLVFCEGAGLIRDVIQNEEDLKNDIILLWLNACARDKDKESLSLLKNCIIGAEELTSFQKGRILFEIL